MKSAKRHPKLKFASSSKMRLSLLGQLGIEPDEVTAGGIDEEPFKNENPQKLVRRLSRAKFEHNAAGVPENMIVLAADTVVGLRGRNMPMAKSPEQAVQFLRSLSGKKHYVSTAVTVGRKNKRPRTMLVTTAIKFRRLSVSAINSYIEAEEWRDRAGGYAIAGRAFNFVRRIEGSYSNIVGLPLFETRYLLEQLGYHIEDRALKERDRK